MDYSEDISLIIETCKTTQDEAKIQKLIEGIKDWNEFINLSHTHGTFPLVYHTLKAFTDVIPVDVLQKMKLYNMDIVKENMLITAELIKVMNLLEENNIDAIAFKGPTLSQMAYGDITLRQYCDLDILVDYTQVYNSANLFISKDMTTNLELNILKNKTLLDIGSDVSFFSKKKVIHIEMHWNLFRKLLSSNMETFNVWDTKSYVDINNYPIRVLENNYLLLYLCIHGSKHLWERIEWILDIDKLIKKHDDFDWDFIVDSAIKMNSSNMLFIGLSLSSKLFNTELVSEVTKLIDNPKIEKISNGIIELQKNNVLHNTEGLSRIFLKFKYISLMQDNLLQSINYYIYAIFKPTHYDIYFIDLPKPLSLLYYFVRPIRLTLSLFKKL